MLQDVQYAALLSRGYFLECLIIFSNSMPKNNDFHYKKYRVANGNAYFDKNMLLFKIHNIWPNITNGVH